MTMDKATDHGDVDPDAPTGDFAAPAEPLLPATLEEEGAEFDRLRDRIDDGIRKPAPASAKMEIVAAPLPPPPVPVGPRGIVLKTAEDILRFATRIHGTRFAPSGFDSPDKIVVAIAMGLELGFPAMASLRLICVIEGTPSLTSKAQIALCRRSPDWVEAGYREWMKGSEEEGDWTACCQMQRCGGKPVVERFSMKDAQRAGLWGMTSRNSKPMPWTQYPQRMLKHRARTWLMGDLFSDILLGFPDADEVRYYEDEEQAEAEPRAATVEEHVANAAKGGAE